jgi:predicted  nucleic acid-binding Zn-ribbon protein
LDKQEKLDVLEMKHEQSEQKFKAHTEQVRSFTEIIDKMQSKLDTKESSNDEKYNQLKILFDELQKQRITLHKRIKDLEDEAQSTKSEYAQQLYELE